MKQKRFTLLFVFIFLIIASASAFAHPGRTDSKGGHYDRQNGGYHYHHGYSAHQHPNGVCPYETEDSYYVQDDDYVFDNKKDKSSFDFLVKLSSDFTWHTSDIVHIILITVSLIIACRLILFEPRTGFWVNYKYGYANANLAGMIVISLICYGFSLSVIFPYDLKGLDFLGSWFLNGIIVLFFVLLCIAAPICIGVVSFISDRIDKKYLSSSVTLYLQSLKWPVNNDFLDTNTILYAINQKLEQINHCYYNTPKYYFIEIPSDLIEKILAAKSNEEIINYTQSIKEYVIACSRRGNCRRETVNFFNTLDYLQHKQDFILNILSPQRIKRKKITSQSSKQLSLYDLDYSPKPETKSERIKLRNFRHVERKRRRKKVTKERRS